MDGGAAGGEICSQQHAEQNDGIYGILPQLRISSVEPSTDAKQNRGD